MPLIEENPPSTRPGSAGLSRAFYGLSRVLFAVAVLAAVAGVWMRRHRRVNTPLPASPPAARAAAANLAGEGLNSWASTEDGVSLRYPARFDAVRGFGEYTARDLQDGLRETDLVAFRCGTPRSVVSVHLYRAPQALSWSQWRDRVKAEVKPLPQAGERPDTLASRFGGLSRKFSELEQAGRPLLECADVVAERTPSGTLERWSIESRFVAEGDRAARISVGAPSTDGREVEPLLRRVLESFRWNPPGRSAPPGRAPG